jgi:hypothetical protein
MIVGEVDWFLRGDDWIIEGGRKANFMDKVKLTNLEQNGLIKVTGYYRVLAIPHQYTNGLGSPDGLR